MFKVYMWQIIEVCLRCISFTESLIDDDYGDDDK